ncbi:MAG: BON domain-containing protein [Pseudomonadota bacterium]
MPNQRRNRDERRFEDDRGTDYGARRAEDYGSNLTGNPRVGDYGPGYDYGQADYDYGGRRLYGQGPYTPYGYRGETEGRATTRRYGAGDDGLRDWGRRPPEGRSFGEHRGRGPQGYRRSDARIAEDINERLTDDDWLDASNITVTVADGEVTLAGHVDSRRDKRRAEDIAESVSGVGDVQNTLRIQRSGGQTDRPAGEAAERG